MKKTANYIFIISLIVFFVVHPLHSVSAQTGGYVGVWGGYTIAPEASTYDNNDDWDHYYHDFDLDMNETWAVGVKIGYTHPQLRFLAMEFEYSYLNPDINRSVVDRYGSDYATVTGDIKFNNFMFNIIAKYPHGVIHPYIGAGLGFSYIDITATANEYSDTTTSASIGKDYTSFSWQILTGAEIDLAPNLSVDIGYRYFGTELKFNNDINFDYGDSHDCYYTTNMLTAGLKLLF